MFKDIIKATISDMSFAISLLLFTGIALFNLGKYIKGEHKANEIELQNIKLRNAAKKAHIKLPSDINNAMGDIVSGTKNINKLTYDSNNSETAAIGSFVGIILGIISSVRKSQEVVKEINRKGQIPNIEF